MEIKHYASISTNKNVVPVTRSKKVDTTDIKEIKLPKTAYRVVLFDRLVSEIDYDGKKYPVATKRLNQRLYHVGKYESLETLTRKDPLFVELAKADGCIGLVTSYNGLETLIFDGEGVIDPLNKENIIVRECTNLVRAVKTEQKQARKVEAKKTSTPNAHIDDNKHDKDDKNI